MIFISFIAGVKEALDCPLPGMSAQLKMSSMKRTHALLNRVQHKNSTPSSVLLLLYPHESDVYLVFMQRPHYDGVHSGQISLPGGRYEISDKDLEHTALRESQEEVGVDPSRVTILGKLSKLFIPPSNFMVTPFVGYVLERPHFKKDPKEVDEIIELSLTELFHHQSVQYKRHQLASGLTLTAPAFSVNGNVIWGATAMILSEFKEVIHHLL